MCLSHTSLFQSSLFVVPMSWKANSAIAVIITTTPPTTFIQIRWANSWIIKPKYLEGKMLTSIRARAKITVEAQVLVDLEDLASLIQELELELEVKEEMPVVVIPATFSLVEATRAGRQLQPIHSTSSLFWIPLIHRDSHRALLVRLTRIRYNQIPQIQKQDNQWKKLTRALL